MRSLTLIPKISRSESETSPAVSAASSDRGSGHKQSRGFLRSKKSMKAPVVAVNAAPVAAAKDEGEEAVTEEAPVLRDQALRGHLPPPSQVPLSWEPQSFLLNSFNFKVHLVFFLFMA